jgi:hypothetical protein
VARYVFRTTGRNTARAVAVTIIESRIFLYVPAFGFSMRKSILTKVVYYDVTSLIGSLAEQTDAGASFAAIIAFALRSCRYLFFVAALS